MKTKPCWPGKWYLLGAAIVAAGVGVLMAVQLDPQYGPMWAFVLAWCGIVLVWELVKAWLRTRPMGPWRVYQLDRENVSARHLLTRRTRTMPLATSHLYIGRLWLSGRWLVLSKQQLTTVKEAIALYRAGDALWLPLEKEFEQPLHDRLKRVPELFNSPRFEKQNREDTP